MSIFMSMDFPAPNEVENRILTHIQEEHQQQLDTLEDCISIQQFCIGLLPKPTESTNLFIDRVYRNKEYLDSLTIPTTLKMYNSTKIEELFTTLYSYKGLDLKDDDDWHKHTLTEMVLHIADSVLMDNRFVLDTKWYNLGGNK